MNQHTKQTQQTPQPPKNPPQEPQKPQQGWVSALALAHAYRVTVPALKRILRACGVPSHTQHLTAPGGRCTIRTYYPSTLYPRQRRK